MNKFIYPATIDVDTAGFYLVTFPDVPEAGTDAENREEAIAEAPDSLIAALGGYMANHCIHCPTLLAPASGVSGDCPSRCRHGPRARALQRLAKKPTVANAKMTKTRDFVTDLRKCI